MGLYRGVACVSDLGGGEREMYYDPSKLLVAREIGV